MRLRDQVIGALNLFRAAPGLLDPEDLRIGQALADVATIGLLHERNLRRSETVAEQLQGALNSRIIIEQAKGKLAERLGTDMDEAFRVLRAHARDRKQRLTDTARYLIEDPAADFPAPGPPAAGPGRLNVSVAAGESGPVVVLSGEADLTTAARLSQALTAQISGGARYLTVDLSRLRFADAAAIRALVLASRTLNDQGRDAGASPATADGGPGTGAAGHGPGVPGPGRDGRLRRTGPALKQRRAAQPGRGAVDLGRAAGRVACTRVPACAPARSGP